MLSFSKENPTHMRPPRALMRGVRITGLIGVLVMDSMCRNPDDRASFKCQGHTDGKEILQTKWNLVRSVRVQAMVTNTDTQTRSHPDKESRDRDPMPVKHE